MFTIGFVFILSPWLSLQGLKLKQYIDLNNSKPVTTISKGITVEVMEISDFDSGFGVARAYSPPESALLKNTTNSDLSVTNSVTSSLINLRHPIPIPIPMPQVKLISDSINTKSNMSLNAGISLDYKWPLTKQGIITSTFGIRYLGASKDFHYGVDIAAIAGTPILASQSGIVTYASWQGGYGQVVFVSHLDGSETRYAHMSRISVNEGQQISQGEKLGEVGSTGFTTGPHLHFEVHIDGKAVNPIDYLLGPEQGAAVKNHNSLEQAKTTKS